MYYKNANITLPTGQTLADFNWKIEEVQYNWIFNTCKILVRCEPDKNERQVQWFDIKLTNIAGEMTKTQCIDQVKIVIPGTVEVIK